MTQVTRKGPRVKSNLLFNRRKPGGVLGGRNKFAGKILSTTPATTTSSTSSSSNPPSRINLSDLTVTDDIECKFTLGNFKMLYVVNSESYLYKHSSLLKAKKVSKNL